MRFELLSSFSFLFLIILKGNGNMYFQNLECEIEIKNELVKFK